MKASLPQSLFFAAVLTFSITLPTLALDSTPSASPNDDAVTENIKARLIETINQISPQDKPKTLGYVGKVRDIVQNTIVIEDKSGKKNIIVDGDINIVRSPGNTVIKLENVRIDDGIIAIGTPMENSDELQGKRVIVSENPFAPPIKTSGIATITKITKSSLGLSAVGNSSPITLDTTNKTIVKNSVKLLDFSDLSLGDTVIYSALVDAKDPTDLTATIVMKVSPSSASAE